MNGIKGARLSYPGFGGHFYKSKGSTIEFVDDNRWLMN
jgi:hypothetical protein